MSGPAAGRFDPTPCTIWGPVAGVSSTKEPITTMTKLFEDRYLKFRSPYGSESLQNRQTSSNTTVTIRMRRDPGTETVDAAMEIRHRGSTYSIVTVNPIDFATDEVEFTCIRVQTCPPIAAPAP